MRWQGVVICGGSEQGTDLSGESHVMPRPVAAAKEYRRALLSRVA